MLQAEGVAYPAIIVKDMQASLEFYARLGLSTACGRNTRRGYCA